MAYEKGSSQSASQQLVRAILVNLSNTLVGLNCSLISLNSTPVSLQLALEPGLWRLPLEVYAAGISEPLPHSSLFLVYFVANFNENSIRESALS